MSVYQIIRGAKAIQDISAVQNADGSDSGPNLAVATFNPTGSLTPATNQGFQMYVTGVGTVSASVQIVASNDGVHWTNLGSAVAIPSGTSYSSALSYNSNAPYAYFSAFVTAISGTSAAVYCNVCA